jgi:Intracellular proteinase inhibitor
VDRCDSLAGTTRIGCHSDTPAGGCALASTRYDFGWDRHNGIVTTARPTAATRKHRGAPTARPWTRGLATLLLGLLGLAAEGAALDLLLKADKSTYAPGEPITLTLEVPNRGPHPVTLHFRSDQRYDIVIRDSQGREVWRWSAEQMFAQVLGEEILPPGSAALTYGVTLRERLAPGRYTVVGIIPAEGGPISASLDLTIR